MIMHTITPASSMYYLSTLPPSVAAKTISRYVWYMQETHASRNR